MGLDMYIEKYPRIEGVSIEQISVFEDWINWKNDKDAAGKTFTEWTGLSEDKLPDAKHRKELKKFFSTKYWAWDDEHRYPHKRIHDQVAYWRKANAIHKWFVDHVQDGEDDCGYHDEVSKDVLEELKDACATVLQNAVLTHGRIKNGERLNGGEWEPIYEDGLVVANPEVCEETLPTESGFFFGGTQYNEWYIADIKETFEVCCKLLGETDFDKFVLYYRSSW